LAGREHVTLVYCRCQFATFGDLMSRPARDDSGESPAVAVLHPQLECAPFPKS
jgi:hypothetical protein